MISTQTYNLQQILSGWIVNNNPAGVLMVLRQNGLVSPTANPSKAEMANILYNYYLTNGSVAFISLLKQIPVNENISVEDKAALANAYEEIRSSSSGNIVTAYPSAARVSDQSTAKWWNDVIDIVLGTETTTVAPTVTTTTTTSPLVIGGLIAAVILVLGLAYFLIGKSS